MKFSTPFTLTATTLFMMGSTDAHLRGQRSLETTDDVGGACTGEDENPCFYGRCVHCCAGLDEEFKDWDGDGKNYWKCMIKDRSRRSLEDDPDVPKGCTGEDEDPWSSGSEVPCCAGLEEELNNWDGDGNYYYKCWLLGTSDNDDHHRSLETTDPGIQHDCTTPDLDPWASGSYVPCCAGLTEEQMRDKTTVCLDRSSLCTVKNRDPWASGSYVPCCAGLEEKQNLEPSGFFCLNVSDAIP